LENKKGERKNELSIEVENMYSKNTAQGFQASIGIWAKELDVKSKVVDSIGS